MQELTAKEQAAIEYYCNPGSETCNKWCASYKKANYSTCIGWMANAGRVHRKDHIKAAIAVYRAKIVGKIDVSTDEIIQELRKLAGLDPGAKNLNNAERIRSLELLGKHKRMFIDRLETEDTGIRELSEREAIEAKRIASIRLASSDW